MSELGMAASHREIGATVARLFEDVRGETKRAIETKLGRASMATGLPRRERHRRDARPASRGPATRRRRLALIVGVSVGAVALIGAGGRSA